MASKKLDSHFIKWDITASNDEKLIRVQIDLGLEGYATYIRILEVISATGGRYEYNLNALKYAIHNAKPEVIEQVINNYGLFVIEGNEFYSPRRVRDTSKILEAKKRRSEAGKKGGKKSAQIRAEKANKPDTPKQPTGSNISTSNNTLDVSYNTTPQEAFETPKQQENKIVITSEPCDECTEFYGKVGYYHISNSDYYRNANDYCIEGKTPEEFIEWIDSKYDLRKEYK